MKLRQFYAAEPKFQFLGAGYENFDKLTEPRRELLTSVSFDNSKSRKKFKKKE